MLRKLSLVTVVVLLVALGGATGQAAQASSKSQLNYTTGLTQIRYANAYCESGGNPHAIGWHGIYRGKWQFDQSTWNAYAPPGWKGADPAYAPERVQDQTALRVPYDAWPNC